METSQIQWKPDPHLVECLIQFAKKHGQKPEEIITQAVIAYLESQVKNEFTVVDDPLIGLFSGLPDLAERSEEILQQAFSKTAE
ncbi:MAG: hypothetical protein HC852_22755 [Acaryochloridaceae cyanobacterium RU_4_10]|nr:hypothetical protein [Acaryochloridaceae cyanobacterium RU_4_10]